MAQDTLVSVKHTQLVLTISFRCNGRCRSCLSDCGPGRRRMMTAAQTIEYVDSAAELDTVVNVGFAGGEVFLPTCYEVMLETARYISGRFETPLSASTNAYWAKDRDTARRRLEPLVRLGLSTLLVSCDEYHLATVPMERIAHALLAATELGVRCTVQTITSRNAPRAKDYRDALNLGDSAIQWVDNPITPVGRAAREVPLDDLELRKGISIGHCTISRILLVDPDGTVRPCCGAGLVADRLAVGDLTREPFPAIVRRMNVDPVLAMLGMWGGPLGLARQLASLGLPDYLERTYTCACHTCYAILSDSRALTLLEGFFHDNWEAILAHQAWAEEEMGLHKMVVHQEDNSGSSQGTGFLPAELQSG